MYYTLILLEKVPISPIKHTFVVITLLFPEYKGHLSYIQGFFEKKINPLLLFWNKNCLQETFYMFIVVVVF